MSEVRKIGYEKVRVKV